MNTIDITLRKRYLGGAGVAKKIRRAGLIPGVLYGVGTENRMVACDPRPLTKALSSDFGRNQLLKIKVAGEDTELLALCRDVQIHPVTRRIQHADFFSIDPKQVIQLNVPIRLTGRSAGQKIGGKLIFVRRFVQVQCTAETLPPAISMALEPFNKGDIVGVDDLPFPEGVKPMYRKAFKVFEIKAPRVAKTEDEDAKAAE